ncbi:MAG: chaperonin family protein RbcX [Cyanobacteria bacterium P01_E01_bin.42]
MNAKNIARETARTLQSYLTYQAVRTISDQLRETNPSQAVWLSHYSAGKMQDGEAYLEGLMLERKDLVLRILTVREEIAETVLEFLPEMVTTNIQQANGDRRRAVLERLTQIQDVPAIASEEIPQENSLDHSPADLYREQSDSEAREE